MRLLKIISRIGILAISTYASAQTQDPQEAQPERPTVATHAGTVAPGRIELEFGVERDRFNDRSHGGGASILTKIGVAPRLQLGIFTPLSRSAGGGTTGAGDFGAEMKWRLTPNAPVVGAFAIQSAIKFPTGSTILGRGTGTTDFSLLLISSRQIRNAVEIDINLGYTRRSGDGTSAPRNATLWTAAFGGTVHGPVGWAAEIYGYPGTGGPAGSPPIVALLGGPTFKLRKWLVLDGGVIGPLHGPQPRAVYAGITYNIGK